MKTKQQLLKEAKHLEQKLNAVKKQIYLQEVKQFKKAAGILKEDEYSDEEVYSGSQMTVYEAFEKAGIDTTRMVTVVSHAASSAPGGTTDPKVGMKASKLIGTIEDAISEYGEDGITYEFGSEEYPGAKLVITIDEESLEYAVFQ